LTCGTHRPLVEALDESVGAVTRAIDNDGLADRTLVLFF